MLRATLIRTLTVSLASAGLWLALTQQQPPQPLTVTRIADDLHVIVGSGGNVAVYVTDEGLILVDDKFERNYAEIMEKVKGISNKPVRYLLNTHLHGDHTGGNAKFLEAGTEIISHESARIQMEEKKMPGVPRLSFTQEFTVRLGGKTVRARHLGRGHTSTDAFMLFPAHRVIHTGDMFVQGVPFIDYSSGGSGVQWTRTIHRALELEFDTVIPGHGPILKREDLLKWNQSFEQMKLQVSSLKRQGKSREDVAAAVKPESFPGWGPSSSWAQRTFPGLWDELGK